MARLTTADLENILTRAADSLLAWLDQHGCRCDENGFVAVPSEAHPLAEEVKSLEMAVLAFAKKLDENQLEKDEADPDCQRTRSSLVLDAIAFTGKEPVKELLDWYSSLPPWEAP